MSQPCSRLIRVTVAPLFAAPSRRAEQVTQALLGAEVALLEARRGWSRVRMEDGYEGWTPAAALAALPARWQPPFAEIHDLWANLRPAPDYRQAPRLGGTVGARLPLVTARDGWSALRLPDGPVVWVESHRLRPADCPRRPDPPAILRTARRFLGVPYLWGGCSPLGLDCSGFVQLVFRLHGVALPRDAGPQRAFAIPLPATAAGPADLAFFGEEGRVTHVAILLGNGRMIHAAGGDRVRIDPLATPRYQPRLLDVRRVLPRKA